MSKKKPRPTTGDKTSETSTRPTAPRPGVGIDDFPDAVCVLSSGLQLLDVNNAYCSLFGQPRDHLLGSSIQTIHPEIGSRLPSLFNSLQTGVRKELDCRHQTPDGGILELSVSLAKASSPSGDILVTAWRDISDRKRPEKAPREGENRLAEAQRLARIGSWTWDIATRAMSWSEEMYRIFGLIREDFEATYGTFIEAVHPEDRDLVIQAIEAALSGKQPLDIDHRIAHPDGSTLFVHQQGEVRYEDGRPVSMFGTVQDISRRRAISEKLLQQAQILDQVRDSIVSTNLDGIVTTWNRGAERIFGYGAAEAIGRHISFVYPEEERGRLESDVIAPLQAQGTHETEVRLRRKSGEEFHGLLSLSMLSNSQSQPAGMVGVVIDITERILDQKRLEFLAHRDSLTDLPNRTLFEERLEHALERHRRTGKSVAVLFLDLDRFKQINDSLGHAGGDQALRIVAGRLRQAVRLTDTVARISGDEFVVILEDIQSENDVRKTAKKILEAVGGPVRLGGLDFHITTSIGISLFPRDGNDGQSLVKCADEAMYRAKEAGRNTFWTYSKDMRTDTFENLSMENRLRVALENDEFELLYQPQIDRRTGRVTAVEALLRWRHPEMGLMAPAEFLRLLEDTGLILPVGEWMLKVAFRQMKAWDAAGESVGRLCINLSSLQLQHQDLPAVIQRAAEITRFRLTALEFEITESALMTGGPMTLDNVRALGEMGVRFAIDDFGAGYSALGYLQRLPIDTLKIDRSFIQHMVTNPHDAALVRAIIAMARDLKLHVVAEGVEEKSQLSFLSEQECERVQGFYFSRPVPAGEVLSVIKQLQGTGASEMQYDP